jgi:hypothetical protein
MHLGLWEKPHCLGLHLFFMNYLETVTYFSQIWNLIYIDDFQSEQDTPMEEHKRIPPIEVLGDNFDLTVSPSHMAIDHQRKSLHWFLVLVKQKRITADLVDDIHVSSKDKGCIKTCDWIPTTSELTSLTKNMTFHVARILLKYIEFLEPVRQCFPKNITHQFVEHTKLKSHFLNCDLIEASENSSQGK